MSFSKPCVLGYASVFSNDNVLNDNVSSEMYAAKQLVRYTSLTKTLPDLDTLKFTDNLFQRCRLIMSRDYRIGFVLQY